VTTSPFRLGRYGAVISLPGLRPLLLAAFIGRLPVSMVSLSIVLLVREQNGSYAVAGAVAAAQALASGASGPVLGRLMDRLGQTRVLVACAIGFPASVAGLIAVAEIDPDPLPLIACAVPFGVLLPPLFAALRTLLGQFPDDLIETAYALEAVMQELIFILGPLIVAVLATSVSPEAALAVTGVLALAGTLAFAATPASRNWRGSGASGHVRFVALASPAIRTLVIVSAAFGIAWGTLEVGLPAFADARGSAASAGLLLAGMACSSMAGGLLYGTRSWSIDHASLLIRISALFAIALTPLALADSMAVMFSLLLIAGVFIAPWAATSYLLVGRLAPAGAVTEAFSWEATAAVAGFAAGGALSGMLIESASVSVAFLVSAFVGGAAAIAAWMRRSSLRV
jgi:predicted MFS family arabinose efflux permease